MPREASAWSLLLAWTLALSAGCATAVPRTAPDGGQEGRVTFASLTFPPTSRLSLDRDGEATVVEGDLRLPPGDGRVPAVVLLHGAGGVSVNLAEWVTELNRAGMAGFVVDSFGPRGIRETRTGVARINISSRVVDAYRALASLAAHPRIDRERIALLGFSAGGGVVLLARQTRFRDLWMRGDAEYAAYLALYPSACNARLYRDDLASQRPLRILIGTADDQTIVEPCREYIARMRQAGHDAALVEYTGAHHAFDLRAPLRRDVAVISGRNCTYVEQAPGSFDVTFRDSGHPAQPADACLTRGITLGYDARAHAQAIRDVAAALRAAFATPR